MAARADGGHQVVVVAADALAKIGGNIELAMGQAGAGLAGAGVEAGEAGVVAGLALARNAVIVEATQALTAHLYCRPAGQDPGGGAAQADERGVACCALVHAALALLDQQVVEQPRRARAESRGIVPDPA